MVVSFEGYNRDFNWKLTLIFNILKISFFDGFLAYPRPLYSSNMAKVSVLKWSQNGIIVAGRVISGTLKFLETCHFQDVLHI